MRILVTDGESRAALAVTRSLGRAGHSVFVSSATSNSLAGSSRYCVAEHHQPPSRQGPDALGRALTRLTGEIRPELVLGVTDPTLTVLHSLGSRLGDVVLPPASAEHYFSASNKITLFRSCKRLGIAVPEGIVVERGEMPDPADVRRLGTPFVVRPSLSWRAHEGRWFAGKVSLEQDFERFRQRLDRDASLSHPYLVQEYIDGDGCGLFLLADRGRIERVLAHRRLREKPPWGGVSTLCVSERPAADLVQAASRYLEAERWSGLAMFEFKRERSTGKAFLLEINARPWGSMALALACGLDFPADLVTLARSKRIPQGREGRSGVRLRWWWGDVDHFYMQESAKGRRRSLAMIHALWLALVRGPWLVAWDTFRHDDPVPFGLETLAWIRR